MSPDSCSGATVIGRDAAWGAATAYFMLDVSVCASRQRGARGGDGSARVRKMFSGVCHGPAAQHGEMASQLALGARWTVRRPSDQHQAVRGDRGEAIPRTCTAPPARK